MLAVDDLTALYCGDVVDGSGDFNILLLPFSVVDVPLDGEPPRGLFGFVRFAGVNVGRLVRLPDDNDGAATSCVVCCLYGCCGLATTGTFSIVDKWCSGDSLFVAVLALPTVGPVPRLTVLLFVLLLIELILLFDVLDGGDVDLFHLNVNPGDAG